MNTYMKIYRIIEDTFGDNRKAYAVQWRFWWLPFTWDDTLISYPTVDEARQAIVSFKNSDIIKTSIINIK